MKSIFNLFNFQLEMFSCSRSSCRYAVCISFEFRLGSIWCAAWIWKNLSRNFAYFKEPEDVFLLFGCEQRSQLISLTKVKSAKNRWRNLPWGRSRSKVRASTEYISSATDERIGVKNPRQMGHVSVRMRHSRQSKCPFWHCRTGGVIRDLQTGHSITRKMLSTTMTRRFRAIGMGTQQILWEWLEILLESNTVVLEFLLTFSSLSSWQLLFQQRIVTWSLRLLTILATSAMRIPRISMSLIWNYK